MRKFGRLWLLAQIVQKMLQSAAPVVRLPNFLEKRRTIEYLHRCDLCSGVWIFSILAYFMQMDLLSVAGFPATIVGGAITGSVISFLVHLLVLGWKSKFEVIVV
jgi:hypothetical protein